MLAELHDVGRGVGRVVPARQVRNTSAAESERVMSWEASVLACARARVRACARCVPDLGLHRVVVELRSVGWVVLARLALQVRSTSAAESERVWETSAREYACTRVRACARARVRACARARVRACVPDLTRAGSTAASGRR